MGGGEKATSSPKKEGRDGESDVVARHSAKKPRVAKVRDNVAFWLKVKPRRREHSSHGFYKHTLHSCSQAKDESTSQATATKKHNSDSLPPKVRL